MNRIEFIEKLSLGAAFALTVSCLGACSSDEDAGPQNIDFVLDLDAPENAALAEVGGYVVQNRVVVAKVGEEEFVAASQVCSHAGNPNVIFRNGEFYCTFHGARFDTEGVGQNSLGRNGLTIFQTSLTGRELRVFD